MSEKDQLQRVLTFRDLYLLIVGSVIGSGIFLVPATVLQQAGRSTGLALLIWLAGGTLSLLGALTYGELSARNPAAGGLYVYVRDAFGRLPAFLYGWSLFFVVASGAVATLSVAFSSYLNQIVPLTPVAQRAVSVLMILLVTAVNVRGTRQSADLQNWTTAIKVSGIVIMTGVLLWSGSHSFTVSFWPEHLDGALWSVFGAAMIGVLWAYEGWQFVTFNAAEVIDPQRTFPRAFLFGMLTLIGLYLAANIGYLAALGADQASSSNSIAAASLSSVAGPLAGKLVAGAILISMFSAANSIVLSSSRVFYAMAGDRLFFAKLAEVHPRFHTPAFSIIAGAVWTILMALSGTFEQLLTYVVFAGWIFYSLSAAALFVYRRRKVGDGAPYRVPGYPLLPALFIVAGLALVANTFVARPREAVIGLALVCTGIPAYLLWRRRARA